MQTRFYSRRKKGGRRRASVPLHVGTPKTYHGHEHEHEHGRQQQHQQQQQRQQ